MIKKIIFFLLLLIAQVQALEAVDPDIFYLTWVDDPSSTMTVMWHTNTGNGVKGISYKQFDATNWLQQEGTTERLVKSSIIIHRLDLKGLKEDTEYLFRFEEGEIHRFRTLPNGLSRPLKVAVGGDAYFKEDLFRQMNRTVAAADPDFVILAGDIAYTEGLSCCLKPHYWRVERWEQFFQMWTEQMVTKEGRIIPIMPVLGNHDVKEGFDHPLKNQAIYYQVFPMSQKGISYRLMKIGSELSFFLLDSGHTYPVGGAQTEWLEEKLQAEASALYRIPVYHIPAYPSETKPTHKGTSDIRKFWVPLFEEHGVKISMEHDNHTFKRTFPLKKGMVDLDGIYYLGDGAWGVVPLKPKRYWYLAKAAQTNCYWLLTITPSSCLCEAFNGEGVKIDELEISPQIIE